MTIFTTPPPVAPADQDIMEMEAGLHQTLGAEFDAALHALPTTKLMGIQELQAAETGYMPISEGVPPMEVPTGPELQADEAKRRVKEAGVEKLVDVGDKPVKQRALEIMINRARADHERETTIARGPSGFVPGALSVGTSLFVGAMDPLNVGASFIPVIGEANYGRILALGGQSLAGRAALRTGMGAVQGAAFGAAFIPIDYAAETQQGRDYTMSDALRTVINSAAQLAAIQGVGGLAGDILLGRRISRVTEELVREQPPATPTEPLAPTPPLDIINKMPPQARQDMMQGAIADVMAERQVQVAEMAEAAAENDPKIAKALEPQPVPASEIPDLIKELPDSFLNRGLTTALKAQFDDNGNRVPGLAVTMNKAFLRRLQMAGLTGEDGLVNAKGLRILEAELTRRERAAVSLPREGDIYQQAVQIVTRDGRASTSYIQRRLGLGYVEASALLDRMEKEGIVGPPDGRGKRDVLTGAEQAAAAQPPPPPGYTRLYRGERDWGPYPNELYKPRASFWTTDISVAKDHGAVRYIDVSPEELKNNFSQDVKGHYQTDDADSLYHRAAKPLAGPPPPEFNDEIPAWMGGEDKTAQNWQQLAGREADPTASEKSEAAAKMPEPASTEPAKATTEAEKLATQAEQRVTQMEAAGALPEETVRDLEAKRALLAQREADYTQMYREAAACLIAGTVEGENG